MTTRTAAVGSHEAHPERAAECCRGSGASFGVEGLGLGAWDLGSEIDWLARAKVQTSPPLLYPSNVCDVRVALGYLPQVYACLPTESMRYLHII